MLDASSLIRTRRALLATQGVPVVLVSKGQEHHVNGLVWHHGDVERVAGWSQPQEITRGERATVGLLSADVPAPQVYDRLQVLGQAWLVEAVRSLGEPAQSYDLLVVRNRSGGRP